MRLSRLSISLYIALIFLSGLALGVFGHRLYAVTTVNSSAVRKPEEFRKRYMSEMQSRLKLSAEQVNSLGSILDETRARVHETRERIKPELDMIKQQQIAKVKAMLDANQQAEYDRMRAEREARQKSQGHPPGPGI